MRESDKFAFLRPAAASGLDSVNQWGGQETTPQQLGQQHTSGEWNPMSISGMDHLERMFQAATSGSDSNVGVLPIWRWPWPP